MNLDLDSLETELNAQGKPESTEANPFNGDGPPAGASTLRNEYFSEADENGNTVEPQPSLPPIVDACTFAAIELPDPLEIIAGMAHQGTKMIIGGGSKAFKTWTQLDLAFAIGYGLSWIGQPCLPGRVLFINLEITPSFFLKRIKRICEARQIQQVEGRVDIWNLRGVSASYNIILPQIIERIKSLHYVAVFIDPIYKIYGNTDENSSSEVALLMNALEAVCVETNALIAFGAHHSKGNQAAKESIDRISGSGTFMREPDTIINFTKHEDEDAFVVEPIFRNCKPIPPFVVRWKFPLMIRDYQADPTKLKQSGGRKSEHDPLKLLSFIELNTYENPISISSWAAGIGIQRQTLQDYLPRLRQQGFIQTKGDGSYSRQYITDKGLTALHPPAGN